MIPIWLKSFIIGVLQISILGIIIVPATIMPDRFNSPVALVTLGIIMMIVDYYFLGWALGKSADKPVWGKKVKKPCH